MAVADLLGPFCSLEDSESEAALRIAVANIVSSRMEASWLSLDVEVCSSAEDPIQRAIQLGVPGVAGEENAQPHPLSIPYALDKYNCI